MLHEWEIKAILKKYSPELAEENNRLRAAFSASEKRVKELEAALGLKDADIDALRRRVSEMKREARKLLEAPHEP